MNRSIVTISSKEHRYKLGEMVGEGQFGKVYRGFCDDTTHQVAIKMIRRNKFIRNDKLKHLLQRQMEVLTGFQHPNVIKFHQLIIQKQDVYLVYEYCQGGTLQDQITMKEQDFMPLITQMVSAMTQAEKRGFLHRDIKPANILFKNGNIKIADWGFSRLLEAGETACSFIGSPAYMAPQILKGDEYTSKADVWSFGVLLYETLTGVCPWRSTSVNTLYSEIAKKALRFPKDVLVSSRLKILIAEMLSISPDRRPSFCQLQQKIKNCGTPPRMCRSEIIQKDANEDIKEQRKIAGCVFFLEMIQWCRKDVTNTQTLLIFVDLIEKNLIKLKPKEYEEQIYAVWQKQIKVVKEIKFKIQKKMQIFSPRNRYYSSDRKQGRQMEWEMNPESQWQYIAKNTIKIAIQLLENGYKQTKQTDNKKHSLLNEINLLLDLVLFPQMPDEYLKTSFSNYFLQLKSYSNKSLLKLINTKLVLINKKYYS